MDASQYKDYVLVLLFLKYISDKYAGKKFAPITIPEGSSFSDMVALKGKPSIGDDINKKILGPLAKANPQLSQADFADFNDANKLGSGKEMVDRLTNLISIFENPALDFSKNRADGDDLLGDAYEYLMRHFATESGKSKGQFLTPAEVSLVLALILGIDKADVRADTTAYDPTCGSASLLLKLAHIALHAKGVRITLYGQEKDSSTAGLARMNMILHDCATAEIKQGNTLSSPLFLDGDSLKTFDKTIASAVMRILAIPEIADQVKRESFLSRLQLDLVCGGAGLPSLEGLADSAFFASFALTATLAERVLPHNFNSDTAFPDAKRLLESCILTDVPAFAQYRHTADFLFESVPKLQAVLTHTNPSSASSWCSTSWTSRARRTCYPDLQPRPRPG